MAMLMARMVITLTKKIREDTEIIQKSAEFCAFLSFKGKKTAVILQSVN
jgi:hypothetical protein